MKEIGGFLDIELRGNKCFHPTALAINSCRNAISLFVKSRQIGKVFIPYFTCDAVYNSLKEAGAKISFYNINEELMPISINSDFNEGELLIYTDYWGICGKNLKKIIQEHKGHLLIDAAQAFYYKPDDGVPVVNSCRKFFGVPDGGYLYVDKFIQIGHQDKSFMRFNHLLKRYEYSGQEAFNDYLRAEKEIDNLPIAEMSKLTNAVLSVIDYDKIAKQRIENFNFLHHKLHKINRLNIEKILSLQDVPMVYPLWTDNDKLRQKLIENKIYVATYWPNIFEWCSTNNLEYRLAKEILPLPIDQRYELDDMKIITNLISNEI